MEAVFSSYFTIGWLDSLQGGLHQGELFGFCDKSYVLTITRFVAFYYSVFTGHVVGPCGDPGATQAEDLHGAGVQQQAAKTLCRAPRSFHLKIQKVIGEPQRDSENVFKDLHNCTEALEMLRHVLAVLNYIITSCIE